MLRITIELLPHGNDAKPEHLGTAEIANDGGGTADLGNYRVRLSTWGNPPRLWRTGRLEGFPRQKLGPWDLMLWALAAVVGKRSEALAPTVPAWVQTMSPQEAAELVASLAVADGVGPSAQDLLRIPDVCDTACRMASKAQGLDEAARARVQQAIEVLVFHGRNRTD
jgi:hypothetical protein